MKTLSHFLILVLLTGFTATVSKAADIPCFTPSAAKACLPATITVDTSCGTNTSGSTPLFNYNYGVSGSIFEPTLSHQYTSPGTYVIREIIGNTSNFTDRKVIIVASPTPAFTLKSCINNSVDVTITDVIYDKFIINFGDGSPTQTVLAGTPPINHIYAASKSQNITVTGVFLPNTTCGSGSQSVFSIANVIKPDIIDLTVLSQNTSTGSTQLRFNGLPGQNYSIERSTNGGAFVPITTLNGSGIVSYTDANLNTQSNIYQYQIIAFDDCVTKVPSDIIHTLIINAAASPGSNAVNWTASPAVNSFALTKNSSPQPLATPTSTTYTDNSVVCGANYCYQTTASLNSNTVAGAPQKSFSANTCVVGLAGGAGPTAVTNLNSTINNNTAEISWDVPASVSTYVLYQSTNGSAFTAVDQPTDTPFSYAIASTDENLCYQIDYKDKCGRQAPKSTSTCPVTLKSQLLDNVVTLSWNKYIGSGVQSYVVQKLDENGTVISETTVGSGTTYTETVNFNQPYLNYRIKVVSTSSSYPESFSNNVVFKFEAQLFIPDIFTPNGDGVNDIFIVKAKFINSYSISIFSRWGEVVYVGNSITEGWNGMNNNVYSIEGAYTYKIIATDVKNNAFTKTGTVTLSR